MVEFDITKVSGIDASVVLTEKMTVGEGDDAEEILVYKVPVSDVVDKADSVDFVDEGARAFLVLRKNTLELRTDRKLLDLLREKYESVMESRYFGRGGIEIVDSGQLSDEEIRDLVRLSYDMSREEQVS
ncbi:hypothetical protein IKF40_01200 [Candidatus Saccharibacteria bacterium]|nr:hypothetical protein [Candidatus Saccharibacteria bacterium]MBR2989535.1 hypothetical protein [Candidatus Saccharibacteria bacterium]